MPFNIMSADVVVFIKNHGFCDPAWWLVFVTAITGGAIAWIGWKQLKIANRSIDKLVRLQPGSVSLQGSSTTQTSATATLSVHYSALSIRTRYEDNVFEVKDVLNVIHDSLMERAGKIDKNKLEQLVEAAIKLIDETDKKE